MKRAAENEEGNPLKRVKAQEYDPFDPMLEKNPSDLCEFGSDGSGYISATVFMTWPANSKVRFNVETAEKRKKYRYDVEFSGACASHFSKLAVSSQDMLQIALKGVSVEKTKKSSSPNSLPMALKYSTGVIIKWIRRARKPLEDGLVVNTWLGNSEPKISPADDWFSTPIPPAVAPVLPEGGQRQPQQRLQSHAASHSRPSNQRLSPKTSAEPSPALLPPTAGIPEVSKAVPVASSNQTRPAFAVKSNINHVQKPSTNSAPGVASQQPPKEVSGGDTPHSEVVPLEPSTSGHSGLASSIKSNGNHVQLLSDSSTPDRRIRQPPPNQTTGGNVAREEEAAQNLSKRALKRLKRKQRQQQETLTHSSNAPGSSRNSVVNISEIDTSSKADTPPQQQTAIKPPNLSGPKIAEATNQVAPKASDAKTGSDLGSQIENISPTPVSPSISTEKESDLSGAAVKLASGFKNERGDVYTPLNDVEAKKLCHLVGVVTSVEPVKPTRSNELSRSMTLVDPSNYDAATMGLPEGQGFRVNCFTHSLAHFLPSPQIGNIIILRGIKGSGWGFGGYGVGYHDKYRWAAFDIDKGKVHHGDWANGPITGTSAAGYGYQFCPTWDPSATELAYCRRIEGWWRASLKLKNQQMGTVYQAPSNPEVHRRIHRLISDASPDLPPRGFFDSTVEVLYKHPNDNGVYSVYVTDYSSNSQLTPVQASWCPPSLADRVLKVEMWHPANEFAKNMTAGEYYSIPNNRMKVSSGGYLEASFSEAQKLKKLREADADSFPHFKALLQRKREWEQRSAAQPSGFEHRLIKDAQDGAHFNCTVEVLHVTRSGNAPTACIYITDYTVHPDLPSDLTESWSRGLGRSIVKILLCDGQFEVAKAIEPGSFYSITKLRMKKTYDGDDFQGRLGGNERLIHKLKVQDATNEELLALLRRKKVWLRSAKENASIAPPCQKSKASVPSTGDLDRDDYSTVKEILASQKCPNEFRLLARIADYFPLRLEDCVALRCTNCKNYLPVTRKACAACNDMERAYVSYLYRFFFRLEDEEGQQVAIAVSHEECTLLRGLKLADLREDTDAAKKFAERLKPIIGNLTDVHNGIQRGVRITPDTPLLEFTIKSWKISDTERGYGLVDHRIVITE